ncbi:MAG TPA: biopolymer transporter ExbD [Flavobacteriaceae bacterium]|nr:biopolymer transporter ExbD [Flavobacteriaceae bacterium]MCB9212219.1 biopolymer transporter ExbD [Alteromonas sp.]HPF10402.1 biopolymer transporter ExbD [Flavobacteriaceae bacterium]HQU20466.1 biopolymer transporter ExbD [Flavobacteriaceae bacterium]HQU64613.1 biopolymer transporter ExbD [Flavobacteriaceae bacterium]
MSKFKKKKSGALPPISTASLPDIVFMLLFFFMVVTVLRESNLLVMQRLPKGDQVEKLQKDRSIFIYAGKPGPGYIEKYGKESRVQIGDKYTEVGNIRFALEELRLKLRPELQDKVMVALKIDEETNTGLVTDVKQELREQNLLKIIYITTPGNQLDE